MFSKLLILDILSTFFSFVEIRSHQVFFLQMLFRDTRVSLGRLHMGDLSPPHMGGGQVQGDKALMGGHRPYGGDLIIN